MPIQGQSVFHLQVAGASAAQIREQVSQSEGARPQDRETVWAGNAQKHQREGGGNRGEGEGNHDTAPLPKLFVY